MIRIRDIANDGSAGSRPKARRKNAACIVARSWSVEIVTRDGGAKPYTFWSIVGS
jgi:hypothetical protein